MINLDLDLNEEQRAVVTNGDGPVLVLAGAGSGKTRTITYRVAHLLEKGVDPSAILLVTFTNKAAAEMKARVAKLEIGNKEIGKYGNSETGNILPWSGTFHHIGYRLLRIHAPMVGFKNNFTVLDSDDSQSLIKLCIKEAKPDSGLKFPSANVLQNIISFCRNSELPLTYVVEEKYTSWIRVLDQIHEVARLYEAKKREANAMDFDDLLTKTKELLGKFDGTTGADAGPFFSRSRTSSLLAGAHSEKTEPAPAPFLSMIGQKYATQFKYVLVDEYQDTNVVQASIVRMLAGIHRNILVVGDDAQSIYSFRAANIENILGFEKEYSDAKVFKLQSNYRSINPILELANNIIANNVHQYRKKLHAEKTGKELPILQPQVDQASEGEYVAREIEKMLKDGVNPSEIAVLFRAAAHSQMLEVELVKRGIDYDYRGGVRFFERAHVKDVLAYLRIIANVKDTAAWLRVLMHEEGIGPVAAEKIISRARGVENVEEIEQIGAEVLGVKAQVGWNNFMSIYGALTSTLHDPGSLIKKLLSSNYIEYLEREFIDSRDRIQDLRQLGVYAERYDDLDKFLAEATLQESFRTLANSSEPVANSGERKKIVLSTIHQAKGLEWQVVFIINLSSGAFPGERALKEKNGLEEERRLFYVAVTRAKEKLYLTYPMSGGSFGDFLSGPSLFLGEINPDLIDDRSLLSFNSTVLNDATAGVTYVPEDDVPFKSTPKISKGSFLRDLDDL